MLVLGRKIHYFEVLAFLFIILSASNIGHCQAKPITEGWMKHWEQIISYPNIDLRLKNANLLIIPGDLIGESAEVALVDNHQKVIGQLLLAYDGSKVDCFHLYHGNHDIIIGFAELTPISLKRAQEIANSFLQAYAPVIKGQRVMQIPKAITSDGCYEITVREIVQDITINQYDLTINYDGSIVGLRDITHESYYASTVGELSLTPGRESVLGIMNKFLQGQGIQDGKIVKLIRLLSIIDNKPALYNWQGIVIRSDGGKKVGAEIVYHEQTKQCSIGEFSEELGVDESTANAPVPFPFSNFNPVWSADGKVVWFETTSKWTGVPEWITNIPTSIAVVSPDNTRVEIFRPLVDTYPPNLYYKYPSMSPDGRWLAFVLKTTGEICVIDMNNARLYYIYNQVSREKISWSNDSSRFIFIDRRQRLRIVNVLGENGVPFETSASSLIDIEGRFESVSFIPIQNNEFIVIKKGEANRKATIVVASLTNNHATITKEVVIDEILYKLRTITDDKNIMISSFSGLSILNLENQQLSPITWMRSNAEIDNRALIIPSQIDWDISPDGQRIVFTALDKTRGNNHLYVSTLDGNNLKMIANTDPSKIAQRYFLLDKYPVIEKSSIPVSLLESLRIIDPVLWIDLPTNRIGPMKR